MSHAAAFVLLTIGVGAFAFAAAERHPISITEASMFVTRTKAIVRIQMFAEDLILFQGLEPNDQDKIQPADLTRGLEQHKAFLLEKFSVRDAAGEAIKGQVTDLKPFEIPADGIPTSEMMKHTATYELEFPFASPPEFLTIQQDISDPNFIVPSEMSLNVHQSGTALNFSERLQPGGSTTIRFDWQQSLSEDATDAEWDSWFEKQREATLGITSYSSVYSFIYIDPVEIRHEMLIPLATLKTILPIKHRDPAFVDIDEQDAIRDLIRNWLGNRPPASTADSKEPGSNSADQPNPVLINGTRVFPEFTRIDLYSLNLSDFAAQAAAQRVSLASGRIGIIMTYRTPDDAVRDVSLNWNLFYSTMTKIPAVVIAYPNSMDRFEFSRFNKPEDNTLKWACKPEDLPSPVSTVKADVPERPTMLIPIGTIIGLIIAVGCLKLPAGPAKLAAIVGLLIASIAVWKPMSLTIEHPWKAPAQLSPEEAQRVFTSLHEGMYRSLDFGSEDRIYDVLATTVDGDLLEKLYLQLRQSLELREQGGAVARIRSITYDKGDEVPRADTKTPWPGFQFQSTWTVAGTVEHWGHVHERQNQFDAVFTIEPRDGNWKFTRMDIAGQTQKSARTTLRKF